MTEMDRARGRLSRWILLLPLCGGLAPFAVSAPSESERSVREPAELIGGQVPPIPPLASGGGEVLLELAVDDSGAVTEVTVLTDTPPFTEPLVEAARAWRFRPARGGEEEEAEPSHVLVAALYRDPAFYTGTSAGEPPRPLRRGSSGTPHPTSVVVPPYPPRAYDSGTTFVAVRLGPRGDIEKTETLSSPDGFTEAALDAVRQWRFDPARQEGRGVASIVYVIIGFRQPVVR